MMKNIEVISNFFNHSPKRQILLDQMVQKFLPNYKHTKSLNVCRTLWVLRLDGLERFLVMYEAIFEAMSKIRDNENRTWDTSASDAFSLCSVLTNFDLIMTLIIAMNCLGYTKTATIQLQGAHIDVINGLKQVSIMMKSLRTARDLVDGYHSVWFKEACSIAEKVDATVKPLRTCSRQMHRSSIPSEDASSYYKLNVAIPFLDHLLQELSTRFDNRNCIAYKGISIVPAIMREEYKSATPTGGKRSHQEALLSSHDQLFVEEDF